MTTPPPFISPEDFSPVKGRPGQYSCQLCLPPGYKKGQAMSLQAALRHERTNTKHLDKVQERIRNDWNYDPPCDWGPIPLPAGTTAWDQSWPADRADDFIKYWLDNMAAEERGEKPQTMDAFIDQYNKKYQDWLDNWYTGETQAIGQEEDEEEEEEAEEEEVGQEDGWDGVPGLWYEGGSFFPFEDGFNTIYPPSGRRTGDNWSAQIKSEQWPACTPDPMSEEWVVREDPREEYLAWGFTPDELPDFHASDATPPSQPQETSLPTKTRAQTNSNGRRGKKNRGQGDGDGRRKNQGRGAGDAAARRTDARRGQRARIY